MARVRLRGVAKRFGDAVALEVLDLDVHEGELLTLLGPSGCGKTTTLRIIAGFVDPSQGTVLIGDAEVTGLPPQKRGIGMVFQDYALFPHLSLRENVAFGLRERRVDRREIEARVDRLLELVRLAGLADRLPSELSGGQQQRVALARAVAFPPHVLLMDEPLGALDQKLREAMQIELRRIQRDLRITTLFVTHDQAEAMRISDRIAVMNAGRLEQLGTAHEIYTRPCSKFVADFLGKINFLPCRVAGRAGSHLLFDTPAGRVLAPAAEGGPPVPALTLGLRPEHLRLLQRDVPEDGANRLAGTVENAIFLGNLVHVSLRLEGDLQLLVEMRPTALPIETGDRVDIRWDPADTMTFAE